MTSSKESSDIECCGRTAPARQDQPSPLGLVLSGTI